MKPVPEVRYKPSTPMAFFAGTLQRTPALASGARKCTCGGTSGPSGECEECRKKRLGGGRPSLAINQPGDRWEQQADHITESVVSGRSSAADSAVSLQPRPGLMRQAGQWPAAPAAVGDAIHSGGHPLDPTTRRFMEPRFGHDFGRVRVRADARAAESARAIDALAYTVGDDIVFGAGQYAPDTLSGRRLLAHELTHVVQQTGLEAPSVQRQSLAGGFPRGTNYRFDTYRITESDLSDPDIVNRLRRLTKDQLRIYLERVTDPAVQDYIRKLLAAPGLLPPPQDSVADCLFNFASRERVSRIVGPRLDVFDCYGALEDAAAKGRPSLTAEAACAQCLVNNAKMGLDTAITTCRDELLNQCIDITDSWKRLITKPF